MTHKVLITLGVFIYALVVPLLEINDTHVFNPAWPPHARLHEVWQLATNTALGLFCLWLVWFKNHVRLAATLALFITSGFLFAYAIQSFYGGSMVHSDGSEKTLTGLNIGVLGFGLVVALSVAGLVADARRKVLS